MAEQPHPITPPHELVEQWVAKYWGDEYIAIQAARWGADMELEACCEQLRNLGPGPQTIDRLRAARRPKPPSLKEQALDQLSFIQVDLGMGISVDTIRRALEALPDD